MPSGSYAFMGNGWVPDTRDTNHYSGGYTRQTTAAVGLRSNRWTATA